jgi:hypothetical protein
LKRKTLLIVGLVWPEPTSSAAGWRMLQLIRLFQELQYRITFCSSAQKSERSFDLKTIGVEEVAIELNNPSFDDFIKKLNPNLVMFDRFITEEQFGWRVAEQCPEALRILDAEDFHGLRKARELALKEDSEVERRHLQNKVTKREIVAMYRCDLTLVISEAEVEVLTNEFQFPKRLILYLPFLFEDRDLESSGPLTGYEDRQHFITVGNYLHGPNADSIHYLKNEIWPLIRQQLPGAELHIYGAYQSQSSRQLESKKEGFFIKGVVPDLKDVMPSYRICLAPLRYGAGLKGKLFDAMVYGTPAVMSSIAAEGLFGKMPPNGYIEDDIEVFVNRCVELYTNEPCWNEKLENGFEVLKNRFQRTRFVEQLKRCLLELEWDLTLHRQDNFMGQLFLQQSVQASRYMSKWIEAKNH